MKCANHVSLDAVGTCNGCGKGLCPDCASAFSTPLCGECALSHNAGVAKSFWIQLALMGALFVVMFFVLLDKLPLRIVLLYSVMAGFFPSGWRFLSRFFSPSSGYLSPLARWFSLLFHVAGSMTLGMIVGPLYLIKAWKELKAIKRTKQEAQGTN